MATVSARASSSAESTGILLLLRFDAPAPGRCKADRAEIPPRSDLVRDKPFEGGVTEGAGERVDPRDGEAGSGESVEGGLRPAEVTTGGFFVADILNVKNRRFPS